MQSEVTGEEAMQKAYLPGVNKFGQPTLYVLGRNHDASLRDLEECKRYMCYCLDRSIELVSNSLDQSFSATALPQTVQTWLSFILSFL
jgi:hypothetical protein